MDKTYAFYEYDGALLRVEVEAEGPRAGKRIGGSQVYGSAAEWKPYTRRVPELDGSELTDEQARALAQRLTEWRSPGEDVDIYAPTTFGEDQPHGPQSEEGQEGGGSARSRRASGEGGQRARPLAQDAESQRAIATRYQATPKRLAYYDKRDEPIDCESCGRTGVPVQGEWFTDLMELNCPSCGQVVALVSYPTPEQTRQAAAQGHPEARRELERLEEMERRWARAKQLELKADSELPDLEGERLVITWDIEEADGERWTILRHGDQVLWRELAYWEGIDRFARVAEVLHRRYGDRLRRLEPTSTSRMYLLGDDLGAHQRVERINAALASGKAP